MRNTHAIGLLVVLFVVSYLPILHAASRTWTGKNGKLIRAEFVDLSVDGTGVALRMSNGRIIKTKLAQLIDADRKYIGKLVAERERKKKVQPIVDYLTGLKYYSGDGVQQNFKTAVVYLRRSAQATHPYLESFFLLGLCYDNGTGVPRDPTKARTYYKEAAERGHVGAQNNLALMLDDGIGGERNIDEALYWYRKAASKESPVALNNLGVYEKYRGNKTLAADYFVRSGQAYLKRNDREGVLTAISRLQDVGAYTVAKALSDQLFGAPTSQSPPAASQQTSSSGTGWFCTPRHVVTCWHVLDGHDRYYLISETLPKTPLKLIIKDRQNDLALLEIPSHGLASHGFLSISPQTSSTAERVFTSGFPHIDLLGKAPKYTEGTISATSGIEDDPRILQVSVPVQAGNSGGPLLDARGRVVGIVASKLSAARVFEWTGDLPQNINYAVKAAYLRNILDSKGIDYSSKTTWGESVSRPELIKQINHSVVLILAE